MLEELWNLIEIYQTNAWAPRALYASCLVGLMCGTLGSFIVLRNMSLIGDALSHAVLPGVVFAYMGVNLLWAYYACGGVPSHDCMEGAKDYYPLAFFIGSTAAGLLAAVAITWIQKNVRTENDAAIGIVFTTMFAIGVIGISSLKNVHLDLKDMLFGNMLGVSDSDLLITLLVAAFVVGSVVLLYHRLFATTFQPVVAQTMGINVQRIHYFLMLVLSFAVVASIRTVGVILVVAMLITPSATALLLTHKLQRVIAISAAVGVLSAFVGINIAIAADTTPGPAIVVTATAFYALAVIFAPQKGLLARMRQRRAVT